MPLLRWAKIPAIWTKINAVRRPLSSSLLILRHLHTCDNEHDGSSSIRCWNNFYKRHQNKFFKDRHYLEKDWGRYFSDDDSTLYPNGKTVLEVGCGAGNTIFPLVAAFPKLFVYACDFSPHAVTLVKTHTKFNEERVNVFVCNISEDNLCDHIMPSSIDVVTLIFMLSAVSPNKMSLVIQNLRKVLKPNGYILVRDYATGDFAQSAFYFSEDFLSSLFVRAGFNVVDVNTYCRQIENRSRNITMHRRWIRAIFNLV